jgi:type II secretory pathway pseudopilin PulG
MRSLRTQSAGFGYVEVVIVTSLMLIVFGALFASFQYSLKLINVSRAKLSAISVANERMEYFRSLPYNNVGTIAGIPPGTIPQNSTTTLNGIDFAERVLVEYVDDEADGQDTATTSDGNGIPSDYKRIKLEYTWEMGGVSGSIMMVSNIVPRSIETTVGGGTARINVIDENSLLLPGAQVRLINSSSSIDVTRTSDAGGVALFSGAPAASEYEVIVTGPIGGQAYSIDRTYAATTSLPNPVRAPFTVIEADVSTLTFQIGRLSDLLVRLYSDITEGSLQEPFSSLAGVASSSDVASNGSALTLAEVAGVYKSSGVAYLGPIAPATLESWQAITVAAAVPSDTSYVVRLYTGTGPYTLIPESDLLGNAAGFTDTIITAIQDLDPSTYGSIVVGLSLQTSNTAVTPIIDEIGVFYRESVTAMANQSFTLKGDKVIGTDTVGNAIYKTNLVTSTDGDGERTFSDYEYDLYTVAVTGKDIAFGCPVYPITHQAGVDSTIELGFVDNETNSLRVSVVDTAGRPVPGAELELTRPGYNETRETGGCGQAFFPGAVSAQTDFDLQVAAPGYLTDTQNDVTVDGDVVLTVILNPA